MEKLLTELLTRLRSVKTKLSFTVGAYEVDKRYCVISWFFGTSSPSSIRKLAKKRYGVTFEQIEEFILRMDDMTGKKLTPKENRVIKTSTMNKFNTDRYITREIEYMRKKTA